MISKKLADGKSINILNKEDLNTTNSEFNTQEVQDFIKQYGAMFEQEFGDAFAIPANKDEFYQNNKTIIDNMFEIVYSNEKYEDRIKDTPSILKGKKEKYSKDIADLFLDNPDALIFILNNEEAKPCSLAVFSTGRDINRNVWNLEMIETKAGEEYKSMQYANCLLKNSINYIKENRHAKQLTSSIKADNTSSIFLHKNYLADEGYKYKVTKENGIYNYLISITAKINEDERSI